jgi:hypothetical protein
MGRVCFPVLVLAVVAVPGWGASADAAAGSASETTTTTSSVGSSANQAAHGLRVAAVAWAHAFLTGTPNEIKKLQGPCETDKS